MSHNDKVTQAVARRIDGICKESKVQLRPKAMISPGKDKFSTAIFKIFGKWIKIDVKTWIEIS